MYTMPTMGALFHIISEQQRIQSIWFRFPSPSDRATVRPHVIAMHVMLLLLQQSRGLETLRKTLVTSIARVSGKFLPVKFGYISK